MPHPQFPYVHLFSVNVFVIVFDHIPRFRPHPVTIQICKLHENVKSAVVPGQPLVWLSVAVSSYSPKHLVSCLRAPKGVGLLPPLSRGEAGKFGHGSCLLLETAGSNHV